MTTTTRALIVAVTLAATLTGCGAAAKPGEPTVQEQQDEVVKGLAEQEERAERTDEWADRIYTVTKTLPDGREASCLVLPFYDIVEMECDIPVVQPSTEVTP